MRDIRFPEPVRLRLKPSRERMVASCWEALECLRPMARMGERTELSGSVPHLPRLLGGLAGSATSKKGILKAARRAGLVQP
jgi:hypothetical protein